MGSATSAVYKDDYAYYPDGHMGGAVSRPRSGWKSETEPRGTSLYETKDWYECAIQRPVYLWRDRARPVPLGADLGRGRIVGAGRQAG